MGTIHPSVVERYDEQVIQSWAAYTPWQSLEIISTDKGGPEDEDGFVEFKAWHLNLEGQLTAHHEISEFNKYEGQWKFVTGVRPTQKPVVKENKVGRNDPCPCGSGKKYKKCCGKA